MLIWYSCKIIYLNLNADVEEPRYAQEAEDDTYALGLGADAVGEAAPVQRQSIPAIAPETADVAVARESSARGLAKF